MSELKLTKPAPNFSGNAVVKGDFKTISLADYKGKYLVFFFYPLDFTFVCPTELIAFSDRAEEFRAMNCEVVACSTDSHFSHLAWINTPRKQGGLGEMNIPLLADKNCDIAQRYGVYKEDDGISFRGLFIIDDKGNLRQITINDLPVGRSVDETMRLVQAFQFTDKHGEVASCDQPDTPDPDSYRSASSDAAGSSHSTPSTADVTAIQLEQKVPGQKAVVAQPTKREKSAVTNRPRKRKPEDEDCCCKCQ